MLVAYFSPLAPVVMLLLSAFVLSIVFPRLPARWQAHRIIRYFSAPGLVGLAGLLLLGVRFTFGPDRSGEGLELLSGWYFSAEGTGAALRIRADEFSLPFLILTLLVLLVVMLVSLPPAKGSGEGWILTLGASACFLFISANRLTFGYAVLVFDVLIAFYWLKRGHSDLSVARLFLAVFTASVLALTASLALVNGGGLSTFWLGLALWLRLSLYPFIETTVEERRINQTANQRNDYSFLAYLGLSLAVGFYLAIRTLTEPLPAAIRWLTVITLLLNSLLTWLAEPRTETNAGQHSSLLARLILTQASLLLLLVASFKEYVATTYAVGLILSLIALWVTPRLGKPRLVEVAWSWPYLPALAATFTLMGLPFSLGWPAWTAIYRNLLPAGITITVVVILAEVFALSGLIRYWLVLWQGKQDTSPETRPTAWNISLAAGIVAMVPFLIPGLAPLILSAIAKIELPPPNFAPSILIVTAMAAMGAIGLGYFREPIIERLKVSSSTLTKLVRLHWLLDWGEQSLSGGSKLILRVNVILEGRHYLGWVLFTALVGALIIILRT
jgi:hypothetical protein